MIKVITDFFHMLETIGKAAIAFLVPIALIIFIVPSLRVEPVVKVLEKLGVLEPLDCSGSIEQAIKIKLALDDGPLSTKIAAEVQGECGFENPKAADRIIRDLAARRELANGRGADTVTIAATRAPELNGRITPMAMSGAEATNWVLCDAMGDKFLCDLKYGDTAVPFSNDAFSFQGGVPVSNAAPQTGFVAIGKAQPMQFSDVNFDTLRGQPAIDQNSVANYTNGDYLKARWSVNLRRNTKITTGGENPAKGLVTEGQCVRIVDSAPGHSDPSAAPDPIRGQYWAEVKVADCPK